MGLTHFWRRPIILLPPIFAVVIEDCRTIIPQLGVALTNGYSAAGPILDENLICFNGPPDARGDPFVVRRRDFDRCGRAPGISACRTNGLPYDLCVRVVLIILWHHTNRAFRISSTDTHWEHTQERCQEHLGHGREFRLSP